MIRLFVNHYVDPLPSRDLELKRARQINQSNRLVSRIVLLEGRPTFNDFFSRAEDAEPNDISIIANSDICFEHAIGAAEKMGKNDCWALSRWDVGKDNIPVHFDRGDSQDCWIFKGKPKKINANFTPGVRGCDNRLTAEMSLAGYSVSNPSKTVISFHIHATGVRRYGHLPKDCIQPPFLCINPHRLGEIPHLRWRYGNEQESDGKAKPWTDYIKSLEQHADARNAGRISL
jgi:hypothetical protein